MSDNPNVIMIAMGVFTAIGVVAGALLILDLGVSRLSVLSTGVGIVLGVTLGLTLRMPVVERSAMSPRSIVSTAVLGAGVAATLRYGPKWLALAVVLAAVAFLLTVGIRRLHDLRSSAARH